MDPELTTGVIAIILTLLGWKGSEVGIEKIKKVRRARNGGSPELRTDSDLEDAFYGLKREVKDHAKDDDDRWDTITKKFEIIDELNTTTRNLNSTALGLKSSVDDLKESTKDLGEQVGNNRASIARIEGELTARRGK